MSEPRSPRRDDDLIRQNSERMIRLEVAMFGVSGRNGLTGDVREIKVEIRSIRQDELALLAAKLTQFRTAAITLTATFLAIAGGLLTAILTHH